METGVCSFSVCCFLILFSKASTATDTISPSESLTDGMNLVSKDGSFALGFFSPGSSKNRYLGIWYNDTPMQTVVWVANRLNPINDSTGVLKVETSGRIVLQVRNTTESVQNPVLRLLDSGNLVVRDENDSDPENYLWQSFDYPSDTMLPGMKIGIELRTGLHRRLSAWKNWDDPSPADLTYGVETEGRNGAEERRGEVLSEWLWNGDGFSGTPNLRSNPIFDFDFVWNENEVYYIYFLKNKSVMSRFVLNQTESVRQRYTWNPETQTWKLFSIMPSDYRDRCGLCGPNGNCDNNKLPAYQCLTRFRPKSLERWNSSDWSDGCIHSMPLNCQNGDGFVKIAKVKTPDTPNSWVNKTMNLKECRARCLRNCSCMAYTNLDVTRVGSGCAMWFNDLIDIKQFQSDGQDLYIRVSASEAAEYATDGLFSVKSDVFSFGIVLLEVISGRKNRGFYHANQSGNLIEHAWSLWNEGKPLDVADDFLVETSDLSELLRCIHISLLCVQQHPEERPSMSSVVVMLVSHNELPLPKQPDFLFCKKPFEADCSSGNDGSSSRNEISLFLLEAR